MTSITAPLVLLWRRIQANWRFLAILFGGILLATTLLSGSPLYLGAVNELGLRHALKSERAGVLDTAILVPYRPLDESGYEQARKRVAALTERPLRPLVTQEVAHVKTPPLDLRLPPASLAGGNRAKAVIQSYSDYEAHSRLVDGVFPRPTGQRSPSGAVIQTAIGREVGTAFRLGLGDSLTIVPIGGDPSRVITARIVGVLEPIDIQEQYWSFAISPFAPQADESTGMSIPVIPLLVPPESFFQDLAPLFRGMLVDYWWFLYVDPDRIEAKKAGETRDAMRALETDLAVDLPGATVFSALGTTLDDYDRKLFFSRIPILVMLVLVMAIVLYYLIMVANVVVDRHLEEIALFRSRGANGAQVLAVYLWEALFISAVAFIVGPLLAYLIVPLLGKLPAFTNVTGGALLPVELTATAFLFALAGAGLCFLALLFPALRGARFNLLDAKALAARPPSVFFFHKYYLDLFLLTLTGILYWELTQRGALVTSRLFGGDSVDHLLLAAPALFMIALALLFLRVIPPLVRLLALLSTYTGRVWLVLGLWSIGRNPVHYMRPFLLLTLLSGLALFAASFNSTVNRSFRDRGLYQAGSDARLVGLPAILSERKEALAARFEGEPGVKAASPALRQEASDEFAQLQRSYNLLAIDSIRFQRVSWYREDFSERGLFSLLRHLDQGRSILRGKDLPQGVSALGIWVKPSEEYPNMSLWVRVRDAQGQDWRFRLGRLDFKDWRFLQGELLSSSGQRLQAPLTLQSLYVWELDFPDEPYPLDFIDQGRISSGRIFLNDLTAFTPSSPQGAVADPLDKLDGWSVLATSALFNDTLKVNKDVKRGERPATELSWQSTPGTGIRGLFPSDFHEPLPVIASRRFLGSTGRRVGDVVDISVTGIPVPVKIADTVELFPTMDPGRPFLLGNLDTLLHYANLFRGVGEPLPNEVWLSLSDSREERDAFVALMRSSRYQPYLVVERDEALEALSRDPLVGTGSRGIVFTTFIVLVVVSIGGYLGYFYVASHRIPMEFAILRALGLSRRRLLAFQTLIHGFITFAAVLLGAWIGVRAHAMMITFLQHTERGRAVVPPFVPHTDWSGLSIILLASVASAAVLLAWLQWTFARVAIWRVLRRGEQ